ncbi:hypothetical protein Tcan_10405 [Toxocara canis]|uniref:Uncharacterized protein n=1 Tax=Toxocara canis TaxID=6265 RepID=A0A0B2VNL3_TOXCA|nr:hypothetical protein Tcan_10405 [Toxocara canis]
MSGSDDVESGRPRRLASTSVFQLVVSVHFIIALFLLILLLIGRSVDVPSPSFITLLLLESIIAFIGLCSLSYNSIKLRLMYILLNMLTSIASLSWACFMFAIPMDHEAYKVVIFILLFFVQLALAGISVFFGHKPLPKFCRRSRTLMTLSSLPTESSVQLALAGISVFFGHKPLPKFCRRSRTLMTLSSLPTESSVQVIKRKGSSRYKRKAVRSKSDELKKVGHASKASKNLRQKPSSNTTSSNTEKSSTERQTTKQSLIGDFSSKSSKTTKEIGSNESIFGVVTPKCNSRSVRQRSASETAVATAPTIGSKPKGIAYSTQSLFSSVAAGLSKIPTGFSNLMQLGNAAPNTKTSATSDKEESRVSRRTSENSASTTTNENNRIAAGKEQSHFSETSAITTANCCDTSELPDSVRFNAKSVTKSKSELDAPSSFYAPAMHPFMRTHAATRRHPCFMAKKFLFLRKQRRPVHELRSFSPLERNIFEARADDLSSKDLNENCRGRLKTRHCPYDRANQTFPSDQVD